MKKYLAVFVFALLTGCAVTGGLFGSSPETQIVNGANAVTAITTIATTLLRNDKITVIQAKGYQTILHSARDTLIDTNNTLVECRERTSSNEKTSPDPCAATVAADIKLVLSVISDVETAVKGKQ